MFNRVVVPAVALWLLGVAASLAYGEADDGIQAQVDRAVAAGQHEVTIRPGTYPTRPPKPGAPHVRLYGRSDLAIHAEGVELLCGRLGTALWIENCKNLRISGLTIDYDPLPMTQGEIVGLAPDHSWTDVKIHDGYSAPNLRPPGQAAHMWVSDRQTRMIKAGVYNRGYQSLEARGDGVWRLVHGHAIPDTAAVGDTIRLVQNWESAHAVLMHLCEGVVLSDVTVHAAPGFGIVERRGSGNQFQRVRIVPGPPPKGATEPRLFSSWADGLNCAAERVGPRIEDCRFEGTGDDAIAVYYESNLVVHDTTDNQVVLGLTQYSPEYRVGDRVRFFRYGDGAILDRAVVAATPLKGTEPFSAAEKGSVPFNVRPWAFGARLVTLDAPITLARGDMAANWSWRGAGFSIARNDITNGGSRGIVANLSDGEVRDNRVTHTVLCGIHMFAFAHDEGGPCFQENVAITGNTVADTCVNHPWRDGWLGAICICNWDTDWKTPTGHRGIRVENNDIRGGYGVNLQVHCASDVVVRGNVFRDSHQIPLAPCGPRKVDNAAVIFLDGVTGALLDGNKVVGLGPYGEAAKLLVEAGGSSNVVGSLNLE